MTPAISTVQRTKLCRSEMPVNDPMRRFSAPRSFLLLPRVVNLRNPDAFRTGLTAIEFRALYCNSLSALASVGALTVTKCRERFDQGLARVKRRNRVRLTARYYYFVLPEAFTIKKPLMPAKSNTVATWLRYKNGSAQQVKYHALAEYGLEVAASAVVFHPASESSGGPLLFPLPHSLSINPLSITYSILTRKAGNVLVIPLGLAVFVGGHNGQRASEPSEGSNPVFPDAWSTLLTAKSSGVRCGAAATPSPVV
ncbi:hypothetical protein EVAR_35984_1 [Eumeta japonica]|uniref:Uncharacterized protein n=1 Tax=Eumeta variegata TaxID=151549 RepID=A0A4C1WWD2_EUMVA|nr:hypothetical protein EVAR_35984_1 [Eumeta japonica]